MSTIDEELAALEALDANATKGPWKVSDSHGLCVSEASHPVRGVVALMEVTRDDLGWSGLRTDAEIIAAARNALPALIREVRIRGAMLDLHLHIRSCRECSGPDDGCDVGQGLEHAAFSWCSNPYSPLRTDQKLGQP